MLTRRFLARCAASAFVLALSAAAVPGLDHAAMAQTKRGGPSKPAMPPDTAKKFITDMGNKTVAVLSQQADGQARTSAFTSIMLEAIDFDALAMQTLGKMARTVTPNDRKEFTELFAAYVIDVAVQRFGSTKVDSFSIGEIKPQPNGDVKVNTAVATNEKPLSVDWRVHDKAGQPRINDVEVDGYSLVIHYRGEFERAGVSNVPGLINKLRSLTANSQSLPVVRTASR